MAEHAICPLSVPSTAYVFFVHIHVYTCSYARKHVYLYLNSPIYLSPLATQCRTDRVSEHAPA